MNTPSTPQTLKTTTHPPDASSGQPSAHNVLPANTTLQTPDNLQEKTQPATLSDSQQPAHNDQQQTTDIEAMTMDELQAAVDQIDTNIDEAFGHAADTIWSFASSVTGKVTSAVREGQPGLESLRRNVTDRLAPLDQVGRDFTAQIGALAPDENALANITGSMKSVAQTVQRNAEAMEAAILAKAADAPLLDDNVQVRNLADSNMELLSTESAMGVIPLGHASESMDVNLDVNDEIAKVGESISNSLVGQTVGDLWTGLWTAPDAQEEEVSPVQAVPKTRFEKRIFELQANPDTYCEPAKDLDAFEEWGKSFQLDDYVSDCIALLDIHESIADLYERVVPRIVDEDTFWMRYFFAKHVLEKEEERRQKLLERAEHTAEEDENDDGWGDDDWEVDDVQVTVADAPIPAQSSEQSVDNIDDARDTSAHSETPGAEKSGESSDVKKQQPVASSSVDEKLHLEKAKNGKEKSITEQMPAATIKVEEDDDWEDDDWE